MLQAAGFRWCATKCKQENVELCLKFGMDLFTTVIVDYILNLKFVKWNWFKPKNGPDFFQNPFQLLFAHESVYFHSINTEIKL